MKTKVFGKKIKNVYSVNHNMKTIKDEHGDDVEVYAGKPVLIKKIEIEKWVELCNFEGEPRYNDDFSILSGMYHRINISDEEEIEIEKEIFRADLNELHLHSKKVVDETEEGKDRAEIEYKRSVEKFNRTMIESNDRLKSYCDLHKLSYEDTDCVELFKLLYPEDDYVIEDGVMKVKEKPNKLLYATSANTLSLAICEPVWHKTL